VDHAACCALFLLSCTHDHVSFKHCYVSSGSLQEQDATMTASSMLSAPHIYHSALFWVGFQQQQQHLSGRHVAMVAYLYVSAGGANLPLDVSSLQFFLHH